LRAAVEHRSHWFTALLHNLSDLNYNKRVLNQDSRCANPISTEPSNQNNGNIIKTSLPCLASPHSGEPNVGQLLALAIHSRTNDTQFWNISIGTRIPRGITDLRFAWGLRQPSPSQLDISTYWFTASYLRGTNINYPLSRTSSRTYSCSLLWTITNHHWSDANSFRTGCPINNPSAE